MRDRKEGSSSNNTDQTIDSHHVIDSYSFTYMPTPVIGLWRRRKHWLSRSRCQHIDLNLLSGSKFHLPAFSLVQQTIIKRQPSTKNCYVDFAHIAKALLGLIIHPTLCLTAFDTLCHHNRIQSEDPLPQDDIAKFYHCNACCHNSRPLPHHHPVLYLGASHADLYAQRDLPDPPTSRLHD